MVFPFVVMSLFLLPTNGSTRLRLPCACAGVTRGWRWLLLPRWKVEGDRLPIPTSLAAKVRSRCRPHLSFFTASSTRRGQCRRDIETLDVHPWHIWYHCDWDIRSSRAAIHNNLPQPRTRTICVHMSPPSKVHVSALHAKSCHPPSL
jgi:hypothetical protein